MCPYLALLLGAAALTVATLKTSRPDGTYLEVPKFRRMMFYIMPSRNESVVYFDRYVPADPLLAYLKSLPFDADITHAAVAAVGIGLAENPRMNQFVVGRRMYARNGRWLTFSMKRKFMDKEAKLSAVKLQVQDGQTFRELSEAINGNIVVERSGTKTAADKEFDLLDFLPRPLLWGFSQLLRWLDYYNLLPGFFIEQDGMYTSAFVANLGSLKMGAGYHHLYEHGTCPLFIMLGQIEARPTVVDGEVKPVNTLHIRFSYDERIADGLTARDGIESVARVLSDPARWLNCAKEDGSDDRPLWPHGVKIVHGKVADEA